MFWRRKRETLAEFQDRMTRRLGYRPLVFGTEDENGRTIRRYWDGSKWTR